MKYQTKCFRVSDAKIKNPKIIKKTYKKNHLGGYTKTESLLDFRGKPLETETIHKRTPTGVEVKTKDYFTYDNMERLTLHKQSLGNSTVRNLIAENRYNRLGQLITKNVGGSHTGLADRWQEINYTYNIRGWLTNINNVSDIAAGEGATPPTTNDDLFAFQIRYQNPIAGADPLYNGNISQTFWKTASDNIQRGYSYTYDQLNRLRRADFYKQGNANITAYGEYISYDLNGNITNLVRNTGDASDNEIAMDDLGYAYENSTGNSNQLRNVKDFVTVGMSQGFYDGNIAPGVDDYEYDENGNMTVDRNKGITSITYNYLNLPTQIYWAADKKIDYLYNAAGQKLKKTVRDGTTIKTVDYLDGFQYAGGILQFFPHAEGYIKATPQSNTPNGEPTSYTYNYVFNYTDHLGNVRVSYSKDPQTNQLKILEENHYYPFGLKHSAYGTGSKRDFMKGIDPSDPPVRLEYVLETEYQYKYNGKEFQDELGLNVYDMDMRQYDPAIARWVVLDPVIHHSMSPYNAFDNNPVFWADPSGADARSLIQDMLDKTEEGTNSYWVREKDDNRDSGDETQSNDDIRFKDKNGNLLATYYTDEVDTDVNIPFEIIPSGKGSSLVTEPNINLNWLLKLAGVDIKDIDVVGIGGSWDFTAVMGGGRYIEYVYFLDGLNKGISQAFEGNRMNVGLNGSVSIYGIVGDYYNDSSLTVNDYAGISFSVGVGLMSRPVGASEFWAPKDYSSDRSGFKSYFDTTKRSWTGYTLGTGVGAGFQWSKQETRIWE